jgi:hypothetical protein
MKDGGEMEKGVVKKLLKLTLINGGGGGYIYLSQKRQILHISPFHQ